MYIDPGIEKILHDGLRREGWPAPAQDRPADRGGLTRGGITAENWGLYAHLERKATAEELDAITEPQALEFYYTRYVLLPGFEVVTDQRLRALLVDWAFTSWFDDPTKALQIALQTRGLYMGPIDGRIGPGTKAGLFSDRDPRQTYRDVLAARIHFYLALAFDGQVHQFLADHPTSQLHNARGWLNRCLEFL